MGMRHIISLLMENEAGALSRVIGLFSARGYNIESLTVAPTEDASLSRLTLVTCGPDTIIEQIKKQLNKLVDVVKIMSLSEIAHVEREMMLIKLKTSNHDNRQEILHMAEIFRARVIDVTSQSYTLEITGDSEKLDAFIDAIDTSWIIETVRSGVSGISRGARKFS
jgi:acetolactate synthase I/III small subunit